MGKPSGCSGPGQKGGPGMVILNIIIIIIITIIIISGKGRPDTKSMPSCQESSMVLVGMV